MIHPSEKLRAFVANHTAEEITAWSLKRLHGEDMSSMIYYGKETEKPHEAVAAAFVLPSETLTPDKRIAIVKSMRDVRRELEESFLDFADNIDNKDLCDRWSEVIDLARPPELHREARFLLRAAQEALPKTRNLLPALAAAATAYDDKAESDSTLWRGLLRFPETAALAFQRLLCTEPFEEMAKLWLELFRKRVDNDWPANMRILTLSLLKKAPEREQAIQILSKHLSRESIAPRAKEELGLSNNADLRCVAGAVLVRSFNFDDLISKAIFSIVEDDSDAWVTRPRSKPLRGEMMTIKRPASTPSWMGSSNWRQGITYEQINTNLLIVNGHPWNQRSQSVQIKPTNLQSY